MRYSVIQTNKKKETMNNSLKKIYIDKDQMVGFKHKTISLCEVIYTLYIKLIGHKVSQLHKVSICWSSVYS